MSLQGTRCSAPRGLTDLEATHAVGCTELWMKAFAPIRSRLGRSLIPEWQWPGIEARQSELSHKTATPHTAAAGLAPDDAFWMTAFAPIRRRGTIAYSEARSLCQRGHTDRDQTYTLYPPFTTAYSLGAACPRCLLDGSRYDSGTVPRAMDAADVTR